MVAVLSWALNTPTEKATIVFNGINGFAAKLNIIDALMCDELHGRDESNFWPGMVSNLKELAAARNVLAHYSPTYTFCPECETLAATIKKEYGAKQARGYTLIGIQCLAADIKRHEGLLNKLVYHLDETKRDDRTFCKELKKVSFADEIKVSKAVKCLSVPRTREKLEPPREIFIHPGTTEEEIQKFLKDA